MQQQAKPTKTREQYAAQYAIEKLQRVVSGDTGGQDHLLRDVVFDLARAYHMSRVDAAAASVREQVSERVPAGTEDTYTAEEDAFDILNGVCDSACIYTADNLVAIIGSDNDDAAERELGDSEPISLEVRAYFAFRADLENLLRREVA